MSTPALSELVSARLCHDLISPMGAIGNGLELLQMAQGEGVAELALINDSLASALAKLRFYRLAFGPADAQARQSLEEADQITGAMFHGRFSVRWIAGVRDMPRTTARLIYLAILCLERSLPMGGSLSVSLGCNEVGLAVEGRRTAPPVELWAHATRGAPLPELRSDGVQFALLRQALMATGHRAEASFTATGATLRLAAISPVPA